MTAIEQRDEVIAEAILSGRSLRSIRKEFSLSTDEIDAVLDRLWPIDSLIGQSWKIMSNRLGCNRLLNMTIGISVAN